MPRRLGSLFWPWCLAVGVLLAVGPAWAMPARLLVVVDSVGASPWAAQFIETLRSHLRVQHPDAELDVETFSRSVGGPVRDGDLPEWLRQKYAARRYDFVLVAAIGYTQSLVQLRDQLWPQATLVVPLTNDALQVVLRDTPRTVGLAPGNNVQATLNLIFRLRPKTRQVAVIASTLDGDPLRQDWRTALAALQGRATLIDLSGLSIDALRERVRALPPDTALYFAAPGTTATTRLASPRDVLKDLVARANAPVFVDVSTMMGTGAIGGVLVSPEGVARDVARQIESLLAGTLPEHIGFEPASPSQTVVDWRAMQRWRIPLTRLAAGSQVLEQPPDLWTAYRGQVIVGVCVVLVQAALIVALLVERRRRRQAELQAREQLTQLARLNRGAALGALSAALAHEINQPLGAILSNAETAELLLEAPGEPPREALRELLAAIRDDDQRAAAVLQRLRAWIADAPGRPQPVRLNGLVHEVVRLLDTELRLRDTDLQLELAPGLPAVLADSVQVQQVILNLVMNALDALQTVPARQRRIVVTTAVRGEHAAEVTVCDTGPGLADVEPERLFGPFYSTKPQGLGVGLTISRSIIERHGGRLLADPVTGGACFRFTLPVASAARAG